MCVQGGGGLSSLRTYCDWVVSNAEIDHLTQVNLCASPTSQEQGMRTEGGGGVVARVRHGAGEEGSKIPGRFAYVLNEWSHTAICILLVKFHFISVNG